MSYGEKIAELRKSKNMTQAQLGAELNVTYQAVSKWERDESSPDFSTMSRIAKLFNVPLSYFEDEVAAAAAEPVAAEVGAPAPATARLLGVCKDCGKTVYEGEAGAESPALVCKACVQRRKDEAVRKQQQRELHERAEKDTVLRRRNRGLIVGAIVAVVLLVLTIIGSIGSDESTGLLVGACFFVLIFTFTFVSQLFWDGAVLSVLLCGGKIVGTPGVIFSFDLDGFIFLIVMKILFAIIKLIFFIVTLLFFFFIAYLISPFTFIPACIKLSRGKELD